MVPYLHSVGERGKFSVEETLACRFTYFWVKSQKVAKCNVEASGTGVAGPRFKSHPTM